MSRPEARCCSRPRPPSTRTEALPAASQPQLASSCSLAIRAIWNQGHVDEVAKLGRAASRFFAVFHVLLAQRLGTVLSASGDAERAEALAELASLCRDPSAFVFAQMLLRRLGSEPGPAGAPFRRVAEELEAAAAREPAHRELVRGIAPLLAAEPGVENVARAVRRSFEAKSLFAPTLDGLPRHSPLASERCTLEEPHIIAPGSLFASQVSSLLAASSGELRTGSGKVAAEVAALRSSIKAAEQGWVQSYAREFADAAAASGGAGDGGDGGGGPADGGWGVGGDGASASGGAWAEGWIWDLPPEYLRREQQQQQQQGGGGADLQPGLAYVPPNPLHSPALIEALLREVRCPPLLSSDKLCRSDVCSPRPRGSSLARATIITLSNLLRLPRLPCPGVLAEPPTALRKRRRRRRHCCHLRPARHGLRHAPGAGHHAQGPRCSSASRPGGVVRGHAVCGGDRGGSCRARGGGGPAELDPAAPHGPRLLQAGTQTCQGLSSHPFSGLG